MKKSVVIHTTIGFITIIMGLFFYCYSNNSIAVSDEVAIPLPFYMALVTRILYFVSYKIILIVLLLYFVSKEDLKVLAKSFMVTVIYLLTVICLFDITFLLGDYCNYENSLSNTTVNRLLVLFFIIMFICNYVRLKYGRKRQ